MVFTIMLPSQNVGKLRVQLLVIVRLLCLDKICDLKLNVLSGKKKKKRLLKILHFLITAMTQVLKTATKASIFPVKPSNI